MFYIITAPLFPVWLENGIFDEAPLFEIRNVLRWLADPLCCDWQQLAHVQEMSHPSITSSSSPVYSIKSLHTVGPKSIYSDTDCASSPT